MVDFSDLQHEWLIATGRYVEDWHLGNSSGEIYDIDGLVYVHQRNANGDVVREKSVRGPTQGAVPMDKWGIAVFVGRDFENKEALVGISFTGAIQQGFPPGLANPGDLNAYGDVISQDIIHLKVTPTDPPSLNLAVQEHYYIMGRTFYHIVQDQIDVSSLIPAGPNEQCLIGINAKRDGTFEAFASTAQDTLDPLDDSDVQELLDQFTPGGIAAYAYWVNDQTTAITDANIFQDLRPLWRPDFRDVMSVSPSGTLTISSGAVTTDRSYHHISAEAGSSDDLDTITEVEDRQLLILQAASGHTITVKHDTGNITLNGESDIVLSGSKTLILFYDGTSWSDTAFGSGGYADSGYWYGYADSGDIQTIEDGDTFTIAGDGTTIETVAQEPKTVVVGVKTGGIDTTQLADDAVDLTKLAGGTASRFYSTDGSGDPALSKVVPMGAVVGDTDTQTLTSKTIDGDDNTVQDLPLSSFKTVGGDANKVIVRDASGVVIGSAWLTFDESTQTLKIITATVDPLFEVAPSGNNVLIRTAINNSTFFRSGANGTTEGFFFQIDSNFGGSPANLLSMVQSNRVGVRTITPLTVFHIDDADPILLVKDTDTSTGTANARVRLAESGAAGAVDTYWDIRTGNSNFSFVIDESGGSNHFVITRGSGNIAMGGNLSVTGTLSKGGGSFDIDHPAKPTTHNLVHSFLEAPRGDLIYRGGAQLSAGQVVVNIDAASNMSNGTFAMLTRNPQAWLHSSDKTLDYSIVGGQLTITSTDGNSTAWVDWLVITERNDPFWKASSLTDGNGDLIVEREKKLGEHMRHPAMNGGLPISELELAEEF